MQPDVTPWSVNLTYVVPNSDTIAIYADMRLSLLRAQCAGEGANVGTNNPASHRIPLSTLTRTLWAALLCTALYNICITLSHMVRPGTVRREQRRTECQAQPMNAATKTATFVSALEPTVIG
jgi:hypothetical protein